MQKEDSVFPDTIGTCGCSSMQTRQRRNVDYTKIQRLVEGSMVFNLKQE